MVFKKFVKYLIIYKSRKNKFWKNGACRFLQESAAEHCLLKRKALFHQKI